MTFSPRFGHRSFSAVASPGDAGRWSLGFGFRNRPTPRSWLPGLGGQCHVQMALKVRRSLHQWLWPLFQLNPRLDEYSTGHLRGWCGRARACMTVFPQSTDLFDNGETNPDGTRDEPGIKT